MSLSIKIFCILSLLMFPIGCNKYQRLGVRAKMGDKRAMHEYGCELWAHTTGRKDEVDEAIKWIAMAAEKGEVEAMYKLGLIYDGTLDSGQTTNKSLLWFRKGAEAGHRFCMIKLAEGYRYGRLGLPVDEAEANRWYDAATKAKKPGDM